MEHKVIGYIFKALICQFVDLFFNMMWLYLYQAFLDTIADTVSSVRYIFPSSPQDVAL